MLEGKKFLFYLRVAQHFPAVEMAPMSLAVHVAPSRHVNTLSALLPLGEGRWMLASGFGKVVSRRNPCSCLCMSLPRWCLGVPNLDGGVVCKLLQCSQLLSSS